LDYKAGQVNLASPFTVILKVAFHLQEFWSQPGKKGDFCPAGDGLTDRTGRSAPSPWVYAK
jgi:hypothetical protein